MKTFFLRLFVLIIMGLGWSSQAQAQAECEGVGFTVNGCTVTFVSLVPGQFYWNDAQISLGTGTSVTYTFPIGTNTWSVDFVGSGVFCDLTVNTNCGQSCFELFTIEPVPGACGQYQFTANTTNPDLVESYLWSFGDGNASTAANPFHEYVISGIRDIQLTVTLNNGTVLTCTERIFVNCQNCGINPIDSEWFYVINCTTGIFDLSPPDPAFRTVASILWDFGHNNATSTVEDPVHVFPGTGNYEVTVMVQYTDGTEYMCSRIISVESCEECGFTVEPAPDCPTFSFTPDIPEANVIQIFWLIGNDQTNPEANYFGVYSPTHTFNNSGDNLVSVTITYETQGGEIITETCEQIVNVDCETCEIAQFEYDVVGCQLTVNASTPTGILNYEWDFGCNNLTGGGFSSTQSYASCGSGTYLVTLTVTLQGGATISCQKWITVDCPEVPGCNETYTLKPCWELENPFACGDVCSEDPNASGFLCLVRVNPDGTCDQIDQLPNANDYLVQWTQFPTHPQNGSNPGACPSFYRTQMEAGFLLEGTVTIDGCTYPINFSFQRDCENCDETFQVELVDDPCPSTGTAIICIAQNGQPLDPNDYAVRFFTSLGDQFPATSCLAIPTSESVFGAQVMNLNTLCVTFVNATYSCEVDECTDEFEANAVYPNPDCFQNGGSLFCDICFSGGIVCINEVGGGTVNGTVTFVDNNGMTYSGGANGCLSVSSTLIKLLSHAIVVDNIGCEYIIPIDLCPFDGLDPGHQTNSPSTTEAADERISIFPNPTSDQLQIVNPEALSLLGRLINIDGKVMQTFQARSFETTTLNVSALPSGIYFLQMQDSNNGELKFNERVVITQ